MRQTPAVLVVVTTFCLWGCFAPHGGAEDDGAWARINGNPVLRAGRSASPEIIGRPAVENAIADPSIVFDDEAQLWRLYYSTGVVEHYTDPETLQVVMMATSVDGQAFAVQDAPALLPPADEDAWDFALHETPDVVIDPAPTDPARKFLMFYSGASQRQHPLGFSDYAIGVAFSADGEHFTRLPAAESPHAQEGLLLTEDDLLPVQGDGTVADPDAIFVDGVLHLYSSSLGCRGDCSTSEQIESFGIAHASGPGVLALVADADNPLPSLQSKPGQQPSVVFESDVDGGRFSMWFTSDTDEEKAGIPSTFNPSLGAWRATSSDGRNWSVDDKARSFLWNMNSANEELGLLTGAEVAVHDDQLFLYYTGWGRQGVPEGFLVPTRRSLLPEAGVLNLLLATQPR